MRMKKTVAASEIGVLKLSFVALHFTGDEKIREIKTCSNTQQHLEKDRCDCTEHTDVQINICTEATVYKLL